MLFGSISFLGFFLVFFVLYSLVFRSHNHKLWLIALASIAFYATWSWKYVPFLLATGVVDFFIAQWISREADPARKKRILLLSIVTNLGVLGFVKYTGFFVTSATEVLRGLGFVLTAPKWDLVAPLGISFYTFQSLSYTIDVYRGTLVPRRRIHEFIASLTFFPHLVAGPIVRSSFLLPQFETLESPTWRMIRRGFLLFAGGLFKKTAADLLSALVVDGFAKPEAVGRPGAWLSALAFTGQIYGDFAGYTDMATGMSLLLGFQLPPNFDLPYLASSPVDFWRRWHISLSTWLRDYLYTPLAMSNRRHPYLNLGITFVLAGLWHGPRWTYVIFGVYWAFLMVGTQFGIDRLPRKASRRIFAMPLVRIVQTIGTFYLVLIGMVLFRAENVTQAFEVLRVMHLGGDTAVRVDYATVVRFALVILTIAGWLAFDYWVSRKPHQVEASWLIWPLIVVQLAFTMSLGARAQAFIYFQF